MPFLNGVYTPPDGAEDAVPGEVIRSATWNTIFTDLSNALTQVGTSQVPGIHNLQASLGVSRILILSRGVSFATASVDTALPVVLPTGFTEYVVSNIRLVNNGPVATLTTATCGVFTSPGGGGVTVVNSGVAVTITSNTPGTNNNTQPLGINNTNTQYYTNGTIYFRLLIPQSSLATCNVMMEISPIS